MSRGRAAAVVVLATGLLAMSTSAGAGPENAGFDRPQEGFMPAGTVLQDSTPDEAGLDPDRIEALGDAAASYIEPLPGAEHPLYAGAVVLAAHAGHVVAEEASGWALRYADGEGTELPREQWVAAGTDTIYDLASVSKLFTTIVVLQQAEAGLIELDAPVVDYLPAFAANGKQDITIRQLLIHTSGLKAWEAIWREPTAKARIGAVINTTPRFDPGTTYLYSDLNMITAGLVAEEVTGRGLDELVRDGITEPLGMVDTGYNPCSAEARFSAEDADDCDLLPRIAATEYQEVPDRGMVHGEVHDENAWSLGGVAGHAGVFGTARDLARLAQTILNGGIYDGERILEESTVASMLTNENTEFPGDAHGLGFELDQRWYMDALTSPSTAGHTGYTGTSMVIDQQSRSFVILLANRVHPSRNWGSNNPARRAVAHELAYSMPVEPAAGPTAWTAHDTGSTTSRLSLPLELGGDSTLRFDLFADTESTDPLSLEISDDGGTTWQPVAFSAKRGAAQIVADDGVVSGYHGRHWWKARAELPEVTGQALLRWTYTTDPLYEGRGVYVDDVKVRTRGLPAFIGERNPERFDAEGWTLSER